MMSSFNGDSKKVTEKQCLSELPHVTNCMPDISLCGFLGKLSSQQKSLSQLLANTAGKGIVKSLVRQRWVVFSEHTCKLFYFKDKGSTECLGEINIAGATLNYDPEDSDGLFTIMSGGEIHYFAAGGDALRQKWLEGLQEGKVRFINRCQDGEGALTRIQWYTSLPSSPPPEMNRFNISNVLHTTSNKVWLRASGKKFSTKPPGNHIELADRHSSPAQLSNRTLSHENLTSANNSQVILRTNRSSPKPKRPTSIHFGSKSAFYAVGKNGNGLSDNGSSHNSETGSSLSITRPTYCHVDAYHVSVPTSPNLESKPSLLRSKSTSRSFRPHFTPLKTGLKSSTTTTRCEANGKSHSEELGSPQSGSFQTSVSPSPSSESFTGLKQIGADLKASFSKYSLQRSNKRSSSETSAVDTWTEAEDGGCANCAQLRKALGTLEERLDVRNEELKAAKEGIELLQQDLALLYRQRQTSSKLDENCNDEHLIEILREKDRSLVEFEQSDCVQKNEIAELKQKNQQLSEQVDLFTTLVKAKDNAIRSISDELEELKTRRSMNSPPVTSQDSLPAHLYPRMRDFLAAPQDGKRNGRLIAPHVNKPSLPTSAELPEDKINDKTVPVTTSNEHDTKDNTLVRQNEPEFDFENSSALAGSDLALPSEDLNHVIRRRKSTDTASTDSETYSSCFELAMGVSENGSPKKLASHSENSVTNSSLASHSIELARAAVDSTEDVSKSLVNKDSFNTSESSRNCHVTQQEPTSVLHAGGQFCEKPSINLETCAPHRPTKTILADQSEERIRQTDLSMTDDVMISSTGTDNLSMAFDNTSLWDPADQEMDLEKVVKERDRYQESYRAYKAQNSFLHKQILELSQASDLMKEREERLKHECSVWEARFERVRSKYLVLLNDLHSPPSQQHDKDTLARMLSDALSHTPHFGAVSKNGRYYDECGFCITAADEDSLQRCATFLSRQAQTNVGGELHQVKQTTTAWEATLARASNAVPSLQLPLLKRLIREQGLPLHFRPRVWKLLVDYHIGSRRRQLPDTYYEDLLARCIIRPSDDMSSEYVDLKTKKQVELDLLRTLPNNRFYENEYADNIIRLRRVLLAFAVHNREVSYCQGLNRLAAIALLFLSEVDAFWCLVCIVERLMPEQYFTSRLLGPQIDQRVLLVLIAEKLPQLHTHLSQHRIDISMITFNWFLCLFVEEVPHALYLHIWDSFLLEGSKVLFRFALAMLKLCEEGILARTEFMEVSNYLRSVPPSLGNVDKLKQTAFQWVNPLSSRHLRRLRNLHRQEVLSEVAEQDSMREKYQQKAASQKSPTAAEILEEDSQRSTEDISHPATSEGLNSVAAACDSPVSAKCDTDPTRDCNESRAEKDGEASGTDAVDRVASGNNSDAVSADKNMDDIPRGIGVDEVIAEENLQEVHTEISVEEATFENSVEEASVENNAAEEKIRVDEIGREFNSSKVAAENNVPEVATEFHSDEVTGEEKLDEMNAQIDSAQNGVGCSSPGVGCQSTDSKGEIGH